MTPEDFITKWQDTPLKERTAAHEHFLDLCRLLDEPTPAQADPPGTWYCFEKGASKAGGGNGWADIWKAGHFAWEYKSPGKNLQAAFKQLQLYTPALAYPPLLIVCDLHTFIIHTAFTGTVPEQHTLHLQDLRDPQRLRLLKWAFSDPERLRPGKTTAALTEEVAARFSTLAQTLRSRQHPPHAIGHFCIQLLFCLFAEDIELLPNKLFSRLLDTALKRPERAAALLQELFTAMAHGGNFGLDEVPWFNGGLFDASHLLPLEQNDLRRLREVAELDWSAIEPSILGTLFERGLDPAKRAQLGAHYTDPAAIQRLLNPVIFHPLHRAWEHDKTHINHLLDSAQHAKSAAAKRKHHAAATATLQAFLERLRAYRILDPACGSGNFLLLALKGLKDLEHQVLLEAEALGLGRYFPAVGPENVLGIELNPYAAELARVTVWIGEIQWMLAHGFSLAMNPILRPLHTIDQRDALLNDDGTEAPWPSADAIVGNPPFLGGSKKRGLLGDDYFHALERVYAGRVPGGADLVTYWFEKARAQLANGHAHAAGLVATQSIRAGANRKVLERIVQSGKIFHAWSDEPWVNEGAAVRVSLVGFGRMEDHADAQLNGQKVEHIYPDLTGSEAGGIDLTQAVSLPANAIAFEGTKKYGDFDIPGELARRWLTLPNPHGRPNSEVVKPWRNGQDISGRASDTWIIDFGVDMPEADAALYEQPFNHVLTHVKPYRETVRRERTRRRWWIHEEARVSLRTALHGLTRYIVTPRVAKHRFFVWCHAAILPDTRLLVIAREDDTTFGILSSRIHQVWALANASRHGVGNDPTYNAKSCFETYPFPNGLTPADTSQGTYTLESGAIVPHVAPEVSDHARAIAQAAHRLNTLRDNWLNPPEWTERQPEIHPGYPERILPKPGHEADLKQRTLTHLYNQRPAWLQNAHQTLDHAVAAAYGWPDHPLPETDILTHLLTLNRSR